MSDLRVVANFCVSLGGRRQTLCLTSLLDVLLSWLQITSEALTAPGRPVTAASTRAAPVAPSGLVIGNGPETETGTGKTATGIETGIEIGIEIGIENEIEIGKESEAAMVIGRRTGAWTSTKRSRLCTPTTTPPWRPPSPATTGKFNAQPLSHLPAAKSIKLWSGYLNPRRLFSAKTLTRTPIVWEGEAKAIMIGGRLFPPPLEKCTIAGNGAISSEVIRRGLDWANWSLSALLQPTL